MHKISSTIIKTEFNVDDDLFEEDSVIESEHKKGDFIYKLPPKMIFKNLNVNLDIVEMNKEAPVEIKDNIFIKEEDLSFTAKLEKITDVSRVITNFQKIKNDHLIKLFHNSINNV